MSETKFNEKEQQRSCSCPFCDQPLCPDTGEDSFSCSKDGKLKIHRVDCVGLYCPVPVMRAREEIDQLEDKNLLELIADDPASAEDIPRWAKRAGHSVVKVERDGDNYHYFILKNDHNREV